MSDLDAANFELIEPRFVSIRPVGTINGDQMTATMDAIEDAVKGEPYFLFEARMNDIEGLTPEARRVAAERLQKMPDFAIAVIGGNFRQNILAKLVLTALSMLGKTNLKRSGFFKTREPAQDWLRELATEL